MKKPCNKKMSVSVSDGSYRFVNLYQTDDFALGSGLQSFLTLDDARSQKCNDGTYVCTVKITTKVEIV